MLVLVLEIGMLIPDEKVMAQQDRAEMSSTAPLTEFCPFCGEKLASEDIYCDHCRKRVTMTR